MRSMVLKYLTRSGYHGNNKADRAQCCDTILTLVNDSSGMGTIASTTCFPCIPGVEYDNHAHTCSHHHGECSGSEEPFKSSEISKGIPFDDTKAALSTQEEIWLSIFQQVDVMDHGAVRLGFLEDWLRNHLGVARELGLPSKIKDPSVSVRL